MANEAEQAIYNGLRTAPTFHPASAGLFTDDWALESGDVVKVVTGENADEQYDMPVYSMNLQWKGSSKVDVQSTGNQKRAPLPPLQRKSYGSGSAQYKQNKEYETKFIQQDDMIGMVVTHNDITGQNSINIAQILLAINGDGTTSAYIKADKILIEGNTTMDQVYTYDATAGNAFINSLACTQLTSESITAELGTINVGEGPNSQASWQNEEVVVNVTKTETETRKWLFTQATHHDADEILETIDFTSTKFVTSVTPTKKTIYYLGRS